jgi:hypothetical protein
MKKLIPALVAFAVVIALAPAAQARPLQLDDYCSPTGDFCQEITLSKRTGWVKFNLFSFAFTGPYEICVKGPAGKECKGFELEETDPGVYVDKVVWQKEFRPAEVGRYKVAWKYKGSRIGEKLKFRVDPHNPDA